MKRTYVAPTAVGETFAANDYVAACTNESYTAYKFECDAGNGALGGMLQIDLNRDGAFDKVGTEEYKNGFHSCHDTHVSLTTDEYYAGRQCNVNESKFHDVIVWIGPDGNYHATDKLDKTTWETTRS